MKKLIKNFKGIANGPLKICPICGFSFKAFDSRTGKKINICPKCGQKLIEPNIIPQKTNDFNRRFF